MEDLQETQGQIDSLLKELTSVNQPGRRVEDVIDTPLSSTQPEGALLSHTDKLQVKNFIYYFVVESMSCG